MILKIWVNAFIPQSVPGYTVVIPTGRYAGKTAVPLPKPARLNPLNLIKPPDTGYLTDQRTYNSLQTASCRMQSLAEVDVTRATCTLKSQAHTSSGTTEVDMVNGKHRGFAVADMSRCSYTVPYSRVCAVTPTLSLRLVAAAGDPLVWAAADIDYEGTFTITTSGAGVIVNFDGKIDAFPAYDAYASYNGVTKSLFTIPPPPGNTVINLLGPANRPITGRAVFP
jgi:hypothetical protein